MSTSKIFISLFILVCFTGISFAQSSNKTGIGIALIDLQKLFEFTASEGYGANAAITIPLILSPGFRLEPEAGYFSASRKVDIDGTTYEESSTSWSIGSGIFPQNVFGDFTLYYGGRVRYMSQTQTDEAGTSKKEVTTSGFYIAPAIGGEHNFSDHFSVGAEAQIVYASLTNKEDDRDYDVDLTLIDTRALVFFRFYF